MATKGSKDIDANVSFSLTGFAVHQHLAVSDCVLPAVGRNHPADIARCAITREIRTLHHDLGYIQVRRENKSVAPREKQEQFEVFVYVFAR